MKRLFLIILLLFFPFPVFAETHLCGTNGVDNSCLHGDFSTVLSGAANGDTINIATGSHTWTSYVTVNKAVTISGGGSCPDCGDEIDPTGTASWPTTITAVNKLVLWLNVPGSPAFTGRITGIHFVGGTANVYNPTCAGASSNQDGMIVQHDSNTVQWRFDNNHFEQNANVMMHICAVNAYPLIDNNYIEQTVYSDNGRFFNSSRGRWPGDSGTEFAEPWSWGDGNATYVEHNTYAGGGATAGGNGMWTADSRCGSRIVYRYNIITDNMIGNHGPRNYGWFGNQYTEIYNNTIYWNDTRRPGGCYNAMNLRGGAALIYENTWAGDHFYNYVINIYANDRHNSEAGYYEPDCGQSNQIDGNWSDKDNADCTAEYEPYGCCTGEDTGTCGDAYPDGYPCVGYPGWGFPLNDGAALADFQPQKPTGDGRIYIWKNTASASSYTHYGYIQIGAGNGTHVVENREWFYCADVSGDTTGCDAVEALLLEYTPYTYPHPLRGESTETAEGITIGKK